MLRLDKEVNNIILLKKQIKYELSHKGGAQKTRNFVNDTVNKNKEFIGLSFYVSITTILYLLLCKSFPNNYKSIGHNSNVNYMIGGADEENHIAATVSTVINIVINALFGAWASPIIIVFVVFSLLLLFLILFLILIIDFGLYVPCGGCQPDGRYIKCIPGSGVNSFTCNAITTVLKVISSIGSITKKIKVQIKIIKRKIKSGLFTLRDTLKMVKDFIIDVLAYPLGSLSDFFNFMKFLDVGDWGFNLGGLLMGGKDKHSIYDKDGKLKEQHGSNIFLKTFFKIVRILLETPKVPKLEWPSFGGSGYNPKVNPDADPNNQEPGYSSTDPGLTTEGAEVEQTDPGVPDPSDYNKYETDIDSNEVTEPGENKAIMGQNFKEKMRMKKIARRKAAATDKLINETNETLKGIKGKKQRVKYITTKIEETKQIINTLLAKGKEMLNAINKVHRPHFEKIAKLGTIVGEGQQDPASIKLKNGIYVLVNLWEEDMTQAQKDSFANLNRRMVALNKNTEQTEIYKSTLLQYSKQLEIENNKIGDHSNDMKDFLYMKFLEMLIQVDINPLLWITTFVNNAMLKPMNAAIQVAIINPSIELVKILFNNAKKIYKAIAAQIYKVGKFILIPVFKLVDAFKPILKVFFRVVSVISDIGIFNMIFYYFYDMVEQAFSFVNNVFILLFITIIICSVLIGCPIIGGYYELYLFNRNVVDAFVAFLDEIGFGVLNELWEFQKSLGPELTSIYTEITDALIDYLTNSSKNFERIVKRIGIIPSAIIGFIVFSIITGIIFMMYMVYKEKLIQKFIVKNTVSMKKKILNKEKDKKKK